MLSLELNAEAAPIFMELFKTRTSEEWLKELLDADVPAAPIVDRPEVPYFPQVVENEAIVPMEHPDAGAVKIVGIPVDLSDQPGSIRLPAPSL